MKRKLEELKQQQQQSKQNKQDQQKNQDQQQQQQNQQQQDQQKNRHSSNSSSKPSRTSRTKKDSSQQEKQAQQKKQEEEQQQQQQAAKQSQEQKDQQQAQQSPEQPKDKGDEKEQEAAAAQAAGQMTPEQAQQLLDAQKGEEQMLPSSPPANPQIEAGRSRTGNGTRRPLRPAFAIRKDDPLLRFEERVASPCFGAFSRARSFSVWGLSRSVPIASRDMRLPVAGLSLPRAASGRRPRFSVLGSSFFPSEAGATGGVGRRRGALDADFEGGHHVRMQPQFDLVIAQARMGCSR